MQSLALRRVALADEFDGFLVDLDGVVWVGRELMPGRGRGAARRCSRRARRSSSSPTTRASRRLPTPSGCARRGSRSATSGSSPPAMVDGAAGGRAVGRGGSAFVIGAPALQGDGRRRPGSSCSTARPAREADAVVVSGHRELRLRGAADRDPGAAGRRRAVRDQPRPDPADARRRLARHRRDPRRGRDRLRGDAPRSAASPSATCSSWRAALIAGARSGWRWSATGSPPTSRAAGAAGLETILVLSGATSREEARGGRAAARPRHRRPRRPAAVSAGCARRRPSPAPASPSPASSPSPSAACSRSAPCCRCCRATCTARSTPATSRSGS